MTIRARNPLSVLALVGSDASYRRAGFVINARLRSLGDSDFDDEVGFADSLRLSLSSIDGAFAEVQISGSVSTPRGPENEVEFQNWRLVESINQVDIGFGASVYLRISVNVIA